MSAPPARWTTIVFFVIAAAVLAAWAVAVPVFEAPDEPAHWQYARHLHDHWSLPLYQAGFEEANSPPLYYLALAPIAVPSTLPPMAGAQDVEGRPVNLAPPRVFLHSDRDLASYWPVIAARLLTALMTLIAAWITYRAGREVTDWRGGLLAASVFVFLPQSSFRGATLGNDALVTMFAAAVTWMCLRLLRRGFTWRRGVVAALMLAGAYLSKISAIALIAPLALAIVAAPSHAPGPTPAPHASQPSLVARMARLSVLLVALVLVLPWSVRNVRLYGDPFAAAAMNQAVSHLITNRSLFSSYFVGHFPRMMRLSFIGMFGWMDVMLPRWVYAVFDVFAVIVVAGLIRAWIRRTVDRRLAGVLVLTVMAVLAIVVFVNLRFTQPQGRYLLPALPALALLATLGLRSLPAAFATRAHAIVPVGLAALNVWCLTFVLIPAYYPPPVRDVAPGVRALFPVGVFGMRVVDPADLHFRVVGEDPLWLMTADIDAASFPTLEIELTSDLPGAPTVQGAVFFAAPDQPIDGSRRVEFTWTANGARQTVRIDLAAHPAWRGPIAHLRIDPIDVNAAAFVGRDVHLAGVRLHRAAPVPSARRIP